MRSLLRSRWFGAVVAAIFQTVAIVIGALSFSGPPPIQEAEAVSLSYQTVYWIVGLWIASLIGFGATLYRLNSERRAADDERERAVSERDETRRTLAQKRENQALSDLMSEQWEVGVHELLNRPPGLGEVELNKWREAVRRWQRKTLDIMTEHKCTAQDMRSVRVIGLAQIIPTLHSEWPASHAMSMFAAQLSRVADIARKYGD